MIMSKHARVNLDARKVALQNLAMTVDAFSAMHGLVGKPAMKATRPDTIELLRQVYQ